jgi:hypothetical protein
MKAPGGFILPPFPIPGRSSRGEQQMTQYVVNPHVIIPIDKEFRFLGIVQVSQGTCCLALQDKHGSLIELEIVLKDGPQVALELRKAVNELEAWRNEENELGDAFRAD